MRSSKGYLVPRPDGRIIAGSTLEDAGFDKHLTPAGIQAILDGVLELAPALASAQLVDAWAGLRPGTPDNLPILGPTDIRGLVHGDRPLSQRDSAGTGNGKAFE